ncbi:hypothetical protein ABTL58_19305, partial [Acinetobacter baumannii]
MAEPDAAGRDTEAMQGMAGDDVGGKAPGPGGIRRREIGDGLGRAARGIDQRGGAGPPRQRRGIRCGRNIEKSEVRHRP